MTKKIHVVVASCIAVILSLAFAEPRAAAIQDQKRQAHRDAISRRNRSARQRVKTRKKISQRREISYVCPMHPDIRSNSHGTCPKCLMELVAKERK